MAARRTPNQRAGRQATHRAIRRRLFVTPGEMRAREAQFERDIRAQMQQFDRGPRSTETRAQFIDRHGKQLITLLARYLPLLRGFRRPAPRGRRPRLDREPRPKKRSGGQRKVTPEDQQSFLAEFDAWKAAFADKHLACPDTDAIRLRIMSVREGRTFADKATRFAWVTAIAHRCARDECTVASEVRRLAQRKAPDLDHSPLFRTTKSQLSRLRHAGADDVVLNYRDSLQRSA